MKNAPVAASYLAVSLSLTLLTLSSLSLNGTGIIHLQIFQSGSINSFLMTTSGPLGLLSYVRIWHDNSGGGGQAGWFLSKVAVMDLQTGKE